MYKTAFYSFYLPVALAMRVTGVTSAAPYDLAKKILIPLGEYFQVQDDFLDCYMPPELLGKVGTDIVDNKCSWLVNVALSIATPAQRKVLDENYAVKPAGGEAERRVKEVYKEMNLEGRYHEYEEDAYKRITAMIQEIPEGGLKGGPTEGVVKREVFTSFLDKIYKRQK